MSFKISNAFLSSYRKDQELIKFANNLSSLGVKVYASGGTANYLLDNGVEVLNIASIIGQAKFGHRLVTISPQVFGALLANYSSLDDLRELAEMGMEPFDLLYVNPYPTSDVIKDKVGNFSAVVEMIDVGGPAMLVAAVKGLRLVVSNPKQFSKVIKIVEEVNEGRVDLTDELQKDAYIFDILGLGIEAIHTVLNSYEPLLKFFGDTRVKLVNKQKK
ncbi:hypothetical protein KKC17_00150 [Patescibacteria group bacterium]|nr:hypothetical protein [Patescibacteria group bacterium]